jgi:threonine dehydratase
MHDMTLLIDLLVLLPVQPSKLMAPVPKLMRGLKCAFPNPATLWIIRNCLEELVAVRECLD